MLSEIKHTIESDDGKLNQEIAIYILNYVSLIYTEDFNVIK
jgi:hypothetical protein